VADCSGARVDVSHDGILTFEGYGHGARGTRGYALSVRLASSVRADRSRWFVCGPSVRVRLEKGQPGPYWPALLAKGDKLLQCKVDWQSWIDEDEETEVSSAPNGCGGCPPVLPSLCSFFLCSALCCPLPGMVGDEETEVSSAPNG
jgi:hypothetical protein